PTGEAAQRRGSSRENAHGLARATSTHRWCRLRAMRIFIVVAKSRPDLFQYFSTAFAGIPTIEVIVDRRIGRYDPLWVPTREGARQDRRIGPDIYDDLEERGFVIVRLPS